MGQFSSCYCCWLSDNHFYVVSMLLYALISFTLVTVFTIFSLACAQEHHKPRFFALPTTAVNGMVFPSAGQLLMGWNSKVERWHGDSKAQQGHSAWEERYRVFFFHLSLHKALINLMLTALYQQTTSWWTQGNIWCTKTLPCVCLVWM